MKILILVLAAGTGLVWAHPSHEGIATVPWTGASPEVVISLEDGYRRIEANGLPNHPTGRFPGRGNPNRIAPQQHRFRVTASPRAAERPMPLGMSPFGVAVNGVVLDPGAAEWWRDDRGSGWQYEALGGGRNLGIDAEHAHVQPTGTYHYHGLPATLLELLGGGKPQMVLLGWAADGFPIYGPWIPADSSASGAPWKRARSSYRLKPGTRPDGPGGAPDGTYTADWEYVAGSGDLDECNGRMGPTPEFPAGIYHYVMTDDFPHIPRLWRGTPDPSFLRRGPPPGGGGKKKGRRPPPE